MNRILRVILDANIYLSYLATRNELGTIYQIVEASLAHQDITLYIPSGLLEEIERSARNKAYFRERISASALAAGMQKIAASGITLPAISVEEAYSRDANDDYLLVSAAANHADYLVSGDKDLVSLKIFRDVVIIYPSDYYLLLRARKIL